MNLAFLLHLYQPPTQTEASFKAITQQCYIPLIKLLKSKSNDDVKFTINTPLSLLEQLEKYGHTDIILSIKELVGAGKLEITGSGAYHPLLTKTLLDFSERQIILNEYGLGYFYGQRQGFEGEVSVMTKDVKGFFAPEMAVNMSLLSTLDALHYDWVAVDEPCVGLNNFSNNSDDQVVTLDFKKSPLFKLENMDLNLIVRNATLSNLISFKRDGFSTDVLSYIYSLRDQGSDCVLVALDGETFGHHNREGIYFLSNLIDTLVGDNINILSVSQLVQNCSASSLSNINESTWSTLDSKDVYPFWVDKKNTTQKLLWELFTLVSKTFHAIKPASIPEGYENIALWKNTDLEKINNLEAVNYIKLEMLVYKSMHSDQFWWASGKQVYDKTLFSPQLIKNALSIYTQIGEFDLMSPVHGEIKELCAKVLSEINSKSE